MNSHAPAPRPAGAGQQASTGHRDSAAPPGYGTVTPWIISRDTARLIDFTKDAFGARELARVPGPDGSIGHAEVRIGGGGSTLAGTTTTTSTTHSGLTIGDSYTDN